MLHINQFLFEFII